MKEEVPEKLIALARALRDHGIGWMPKPGDAYTTWGDGERAALQFIATTESCQPHPGEDVVWLPTWEQCRQILSGLGWEIGEMSSYAGIRLEIVRAVDSEEGDLMSMELDETFESDREAIYAALLEAIQFEESIEGDDEPPG